MAKDKTLEELQQENENLLQQIADKDAVIESMTEELQQAYETQPKSAVANIRNIDGTDVELLATAVRKGNEIFLLQDDEDKLEHLKKAYPNNNYKIATDEDIKALVAENSCVVKVVAKTKKEEK